MDLYLMYLKTDLSGQHVYETYEHSDAKTRKTPLGKVRLAPKTSTLEEDLRKDYQVDEWDPSKPYPDEPGFKVEGDGTG